MISPGDLQPADILLSTGEAVVSVFIRGATVSRFSHSALYIGQGQIVEAIGSGVTLQSLREAMSDDTLVSVYRRLHMAPEQAQQVVRYVRQHVGKLYDWGGAMGGAVTSGSGFVLSLFLSPIVTGAGIAADLYNRANPDAAFYCSELVALAFESARLSLGNNAHSSLPADISRSHVLNYVGDLKNVA